MKQDFDHASSTAFQERIANAVATSTSAALREALAVSFLDHSPKPKISKRGLSFDPPRRIAVFADPSSATNSLCLSLTRMGYVPLILSSQFTLTDTWHKTFERFAEICMIDMESIARTNDPIDFCRFLRERHPNLPIVLTSANFAQSDLSDERSQICDASVPSDPEREDLREAISAAVSNNLSRRLKEEIPEH